MTKYYAICKLGRKKKFVSIYAENQKQVRIKVKQLGYKLVRIYNNKQLSKLNWQQVKKRFPFIKPSGNIDKDSKVNKKDCRPFNSKKQDENFSDTEPIRNLRFGRRTFVCPYCGKQDTNYIVAKQHIAKELLANQSGWD